MKKQYLTSLIVKPVELYREICILSPADKFLAKSDLKTVTVPSKIKPDNITFLGIG